MAKTTGIEVPASLQSGFGELVSGTGKYSEHTGVMGIRKKTRLALPAYEQTRTERLTMEAAKWLKEKWHPIYASEFYWDRKIELAGGEFNNPYWRECERLSDITAYAVPEIMAYKGGANPRYFDPDNQPTISIWKKAAKLYATPAGDGTEEAPAPGWIGSTVSGYFNDLWLAQRNITFTLPIALGYDDERPIVISVSGYIEASSTIRGDSSWFQLSCLKDIFRHDRNPARPADQVQGYYSTADTIPLLMPSDDITGWEFRDEVSVLSDGHSLTRYSGEEGFDRLQAKIIIPPSMGHRFANNTSVTVKHRVSARLYMATGPND